MGCGSSSSVKTQTSPTALSGRDEPSDIVRDIHASIYQDDVLTLHKLILSAARSEQIALNQRYKKVYGSPLLDSKLLSGEVWHLLLAENLVEYQLSSLFIQGYDVMLLLDVLLSQQGVNNVKQVIDKDLLKKLENALCNEEEVTSVMHEGGVQTRDQVALSNGKAVDTSDLTAYFTLRIGEHLSNRLTKHALFILIARSEVDLHEISVEYELRHSESLWKRLAEVHPKLHLLDHCSPKQVLTADGSSDGGTDLNAKAEMYNFNKPEEAWTERQRPPPAMNVDDELRELHALLSRKAIGEGEVSAMVVKLASPGHDVITLFSDIHQQDLLEMLDKKLPLETFRILQCLLQGYSHSSAQLLVRAIQDNDHTTIDQVLMVLLCSSPSQLAEIDSAYMKCSAPGAKKSLSETLNENLMGEFQRFVSAIMKGERDLGNATDEDLAKADARILSKSTDFKWTDEDNVFNEVFIKRNMNQLRLTFHHYTEDTGSDITDVILEEFSLHLQKALLNLVYIAENGLPTFLAKMVFESKSKTHFLNVLIWIIASRFKLDLAELCQMFTIKYDMTIVNLVENAGLPIETSKLLIRICNSVIECSSNNNNNNNNNNNCG